MTTAADLKQQLKELSDQRQSLENEVNLAKARLDATGVGMDEPMVFSEGFPRADVDIAAIRTDRQKVRMLSNDHKELTTQMEILLHRLHALSKDPGAAAPATTISASADDGGAHVGGRPIAAPIAVLSRSTQPFAEIDEVTEGSPAARSGLVVGDLMVRFKNITAQSPNALQAVAAALAAGENTAIESVVLRNGVEVKLTLVPQKWEGRGLLGCHLKALR